MLQYITATLLAAMAISSGALAQDAATAPPELVPGYNVVVARYSKAKWTYPNEEPDYPAKAKAEHVEGVAQIACFIADTGKMSRCVVIKENPEGYGFGSAAADLFLKYQKVKPSSVDGGIQTGDFHLFTYVWQLR